MASESLSPLIGQNQLGLRLAINERLLLGEISGSLQSARMSR